jgi:hypothetical protein
MWWAELLNTVLGSLSSGVAAATGSYESISSQTLASDTTTITFSSIPATYASLQLRILSRSTRAAENANLNMQINSDTGSVYVRHELYGDGATVTAAGAAAGVVTNSNIARSTGTTATASVFAVSIIDIHNYASSTQNKTIRSFFGYDNNGTGMVGLRSVLYVGTTAVSAFSLTSASSSNFLTGSVFSLYGIKGA